MIITVVEGCFDTVGLCCCFCLLTGGLLITPWFMMVGTEKYLEMERDVDDYVKGTISYNQLKSYLQILPQYIVTQKSL